MDRIQLGNAARQIGELARQAPPTAGPEEAAALQAYRRTLGEFLRAQPGLLDLETTAVLTDHNLSPERLDAFIQETDTHCQSP